MTNTLDILTRVAKLLVCLAIAAVVIWRGNSADATTGLPIPQVMCAVFGMVLAITGFALATDRPND